MDQGRKRHILVDVLGLLWAVVVTSADVQDRHGARTLLGVLGHRFTRLRLIGPTALPRAIWRVGCSGFGLVVGFAWRSSNALIKPKASFFYPKDGSSNGPSAGLESTAG